MKSLGERVIGRLASGSLDSRGFGVAGATFGAAHSLADDIYLFNRMDDQLAKLGKGYADYTGAWLAKDRGGWADFTNDWMSLQARYAAARVAAKSYSLTLPFADTAGAYDGLVRAFAQGGSETPVHKGDYLDLVQRLQKVGGKVDLTPLAPQVGETFNQQWGGVINAMEHPVDAALAAIPDPLKNLKEWWAAHGNTVVLVGVAVGGLMAFSLVLSLFGAAKAMLPIAKVAALKAATGGVA